YFQTLSSEQISSDSQRFPSQSFRLRELALVPEHGGQVIERSCYLRILVTQAPLTDVKGLFVRTTRLRQITFPEQRQAQIIQRSGHLWAVWTEQSAIKHQCRAMHLFSLIIIADFKVDPA